LRDAAEFAIRTPGGEAGQSTSIWQTSKLLPSPGTRTGITEHWAETIDVVKKVEVMAKKADISVKAFDLAWVPRRRVTYEDKGVTQQLSLPAYDKIQEANDDQ